MEKVNGTQVGLMLTADVKARVKTLVASGLVRVETDWKKGLVIATENAEVGSNAVVFRALQKGRGGPWIVRHTDGLNVQWK